MTTPWTLILSNYSLGSGSSSAVAGRKLLSRDDPLRRLLADTVEAAAITAIPANGAAVTGLKLPLNSTIAASAEDDQTTLGGFWVWFGFSVCVGLGGELRAGRTHAPGWRVVFGSGKRVVAQTQNRKKYRPHSCCLQARRPAAPTAR